MVLPGSSKTLPAANQELHMCHGVENPAHLTIYYVLAVSCLVQPPGAIGKLDVFAGVGLATRAICARAGSDFDRFCASHRAPMTGC